MTMPIKFDTLEYARKLAQAGISQQQAQAQAQALQEALAESTVTPGELTLLRVDLSARLEIQKLDIDGLKRDTEVIKANFEILKGNFEILKHDLHSLGKRVNTLFWMVGIGMVLHAVEIATLIHIVGRLP